MSQDTVQVLQENIQQSKELLKKRDALHRLVKNLDFQAVISKGYLQEEAVRLVHLMADPNVQSKEQQEDVIKQISGIGQLSNYFRTIEQLADMAYKSIAQDELTIEELAAEGIRQ